MKSIYKITNKIDNKSYIGQTKNPHSRLSQHIQQVNKGIKTKLYNSMRKYGIENFSYEILEECENFDEREIFWVEHYDSFHNGLNMSYGGMGNPGTPKTDEWKKKMSQSMKSTYKKNPELIEQKRDVYYKNKILQNQKGKNHPRYGTILTKETKRKISEAKIGKIPWNKGKKGSQSAWNKGKNSPWTKIRHQKNKILKAVIFYRSLFLF